MFNETTFGPEPGAQGINAQNAQAVSSTKFMMCLTTAKDREGRLISGVEMIQSENGFEILQNEFGNPYWMRLVDRDTESGAVPMTDEFKIYKFNILEISDPEPCPSDFRMEGYHFSAIHVVSRMEITSKLLDTLSTSTRKVILGNGQMFFPRDEAPSLDYSIMMIHATEVQCYMREREGKTPLPYMRFKYGNFNYNMLIKDPQLTFRMEKELAKTKSIDNGYLVIALDSSEKYISKTIHAFCVVTERKPRPSHSEQDEEGTRYTDSSRDRRDRYEDAPRGRRDRYEDAPRGRRDRDSRDSRSRSHGGGMPAYRKDKYKTRYNETF